MSLEVIEFETDAAPRVSVIVLHGLGADGNDFVPVAEQLNLDGVGPVRFVFPHAPTRPVTVNGGHVMRAWYDIVGPDLNRREDETGLRASQLAIDQLIAREVARGVPAAKVVLLGFSQGCAMTLMTGLRHGDRLAGLAGLSGYLPLAASTALERHDANALTPMFLAHGRNDGMVPLARGVAARDLLQGLGQPIESRDALVALGHAVEWHDYPMQHSVCGQEIADLNRWLLRVLA